MSTPLRAARTVQSFHPTAPKVAVRKLHMTGPQAQSATALAFQNRMSDLRKKGERPSAPPAPKKAASFNTTRALQKPNDSSPIDFYYMPAPPAETAPRSEIGLVPLIPDNTTSNRASDPLLVSTDEVVRPEISVLSGSQVGRVEVLSEVDVNKDSDHMGVITEETNWVDVKRVWDGFVDDLLGEKAAPRNVTLS